VLDNVTAEWVQQEDGSYCLFVTLPKVDPDDPNEYAVTLAFLDESIFLDEELGVPGGTVEEVATQWLLNAMDSLVQRGQWSRPDPEPVGIMTMSLITQASSDEVEIPAHPNRRRIEALRKERDKVENQFRVQQDSELLFPFA
jgi:hypothetical protein